MHYKAWACKTLAPGKNNGVPKEEQVIHEDELGREIDDDVGPRWREALRNEEHLHGLKTTKWRLWAYVEYMSTETNQHAASLDTGQTRVAGRKPKKCTLPMMLARLIALTCLCRVEAILFDAPLTKPLGDITEARQLLAVKLRQLHDFQFEQCVDPHRGLLDDVFTEEQFRILVSDILPHLAKEYFRESMGYPSQSLCRALAVRVMILMAHHMLGRGISIREIRCCNMFTQVLPTITNSKGESSILVLVVAYRNLKTIKDNKLGHLYLTRHIDFRQCGFGAMFMWIHFLFELVPLHYNNEKIVAPLDFSNLEAWSKKHLFFALYDKDKTELPYVTHNKWVTWAMKSAEWILSKVTHIFQRSGAQILADKNCELDTIAQLGQWDMNEMRRS
ncbi:unnamed protein product [Closterium sp. NIES-64]|nr:unnamed protein product [Closterium sp. NIES-64]